MWHGYHSNDRFKNYTCKTRLLKHCLPHNSTRRLIERVIAVSMTLWTLTKSTYVLMSMMNRMTIMSVDVLSVCKARDDGCGRCTIGLYDILFGWVINVCRE